MKYYLLTIRLSDAVKSTVFCDADQCRKRNNVNIEYTLM